MNPTNPAKDDNKRRSGPKAQTAGQNISEQPPASSSIGAQFSIRVTLVAEDSEEQPVPCRSLSSLDDLADRLKNEYDKEDLKRVVAIKTDPEEPELKKPEISKSFVDLLERLRKLKETSLLAIEAPPQALSSIQDVATTAGFARSAENSVASIEKMLLSERERLDDEDSFVTVDPCQKEKMIGTDVPTIFSLDDRTNNIIVARNDYMSTPPPPYEYSQRPPRYQYQGTAGEMPVYQTSNVEHGMGVPQDASRAPPYRRGDFHSEILFITKEIRNKFVQRVYTILAIQLLFTFGFITFCIYEKNVRKFVQRQWPLMIGSSIALLILMIMLFCYVRLRRIFPLNFILLSLLTLCMAYSTAGLSCYYDTKIVMMTMGVTGGICTLLSIVACQHWFDVTGWGLIICLASFIVIAYGLIATVITLLTGSNVAYIVYSCLVTLLLFVYLMYDTQQILGGRRVELSPEEYILGVLTLYMDIMIIFQYMLSLINLSR